MTPPIPTTPRRKIARYGWKPDLPDHRDLLASVSHGLLSALPPRVDPLGLDVPIYDQLNLGSCTANAIAAAIEILLFPKGPDAPAAPNSSGLSRLFIYYNERVTEGTTDQDGGAFIRDGIYSTAKLGVAPETDWPYDPTQFAVPPSPQSYADAAHTLVTRYARVPRDLAQMRGVLASGLPFVFGFTVYDLFESPAVAQSGVLDLPTSQEQPVGGHAVLAVGYDDASQRFFVRNSWGPNWGLPDCKGHFTIPYAYLLSENLSDDFWVIEAVSTPPTPS